MARRSSDAEEGVALRLSIWMLAALVLPASAVAGPGDDFDRGYRLADTKGCLECHALGYSYIGPSFSAIAQRYRRNSEFRERLPYIIRGGSAGHWGERFVMWPQARLSDTEVRQLVDWIISQ
jgi:cytochrome c551/c552